ncbi:hypothetical protein OHC33_003402 [Knufia fluminis]|uniref:Uncharacterized protein n=2 Tax=Knufia TaxID=430999 RepID=A0AAN8I9M0_9EURO|nr:hypothetical protein OHC33_003402 [Knufia fluminis]
MATTISSSSPSSSPTLSLTTPENTTTRPSAPTRTRSSSLLHKNVLQRMRPLPFQYIYTFWHTKPGSSNPTPLAESIPDIATFYKIYNNFPWENLSLKDGVHFFRSGVRPLWEDEENIEGGCWVLKVRKEDGRALRTWEEVCLLVLGGEVGSVVARERDHILGISYSPRLYVAHISIWTKQGANRQSIEALQKTVVSRLSPELQPKSEMDYYYKKHSQHEGWEEAVKSKKAAEQESDVQNGPVS